MKGCDAVLKSYRQFSDDVVDDDDRTGTHQQQRLLVESQYIADTDQGTRDGVRSHDHHLQEPFARELLSDDQHGAEHGEQACNRSGDGRQGDGVTDGSPAT
ncbi:hypothetical protein SDC9_44665 [bioreactor metagenome]|uniref:Uncharacterized protein n=1 Tax=bioreactor metagenome TaxID=1076179 RepID=A0A644W4T2_9ZZZZ